MCVQILSLLIHGIGLTLVSLKSLCVGDYRRTPDAAPYTARKTVFLHRIDSFWSDKDYKHSQFDDAWLAVAVVETVAVAVTAVVYASAEAHG
jgi:hypothetical protein